MALNKQLVIVCGGTRCLINDSKKIKEEFDRVLKEKGLSDYFLCFHCGCFGLCQIGPTINLILKDLGKVCYVKITPNDVERIVEETIINNRIIPEFLLANNFDPSRLDPKNNIK